MFKTLYLFLICILITSISTAQETETIIVKQPNSPIEITNYEASYDEGGSYTKEGVTREGIHHEVVYINSSKFTPVAIEFGFVSFDVFNEFLGSGYAITMGKVEGRKARSETWAEKTSSDFFFYTGIAFVNKVRLENDEIWVADFEVITDTLKEIESDFDSSVLTEDN